MRPMTRAVACCPWILAALAVPTALHGQVMTFEGLESLETIDTYYDGRTGGDGSGPGPDFDVVWSGPNPRALIDTDAGGIGGSFANEPSPSNVLFFFFLDGTSQGIMNHVGPSGFAGGFSFWYSAAVGGTVSVWSGLDAAGSLLGSVDLVPNHIDDGCTGDPNGNFCHWDPLGVSFAGTARSVRFHTDTEASVLFDDVTLGSATPGGVVPEPTTLVLLGSGLLAVAGIGWRGRRRSGTGGDT